jgi:hypothetical protein
MVVVAKAAAAGDAVVEPSGYTFVVQEVGT